MPLPIPSFGKPFDGSVVGVLVGKILSLVNLFFLTPIAHSFLESSRLASVCTPGYVCNDF